MTIRDLIARLGKVGQEVMGQAMLCDTAESLQALAEENSIALSMQEADELFGLMHPRTDELAPSELDVVTGGTESKPEGS